MSSVSLISKSYQSNGASAIVLGLIQDVAGVAMVSSRHVADKFRKRHDNVLRAIKNLECSNDFRALNFEEKEIRVLTGSGSEVVEYLMTRDGFMFLVMGFTGPEAAKVKEAFIAAFNEYEKAHKELGRAPLVPQDPAGLLRFAAGEIDRLNDALAVTAKERDDARDWIPIADAWRLVPGYAARTHPSKNQLREILKGLSWDLNVQPRQQFIAAANGKDYRPYLFHVSVWNEYMKRVTQ